MSEVPLYPASSFHLQAEGLQRGTALEGWAAIPALEATQVQIDGFLSQLPYKCHQNRVASVGD